MKFKTKLQNSHLVIKARISFREKIDQEKLEQFAKNNIEGFFTPKMIKKKCIKYIGNPGMPLSEYLKRPITRHEFFNMMEQFVQAARSLWKNGLAIESFISDISHVYINGMTKEIQLIYLPILQNKGQNSFMELMEAVIYTSNSSEENTDYSYYFAQFLRNLGPIQIGSIEKLENYIANERGSVKQNPSGTDGSFEGRTSDFRPADGSEDQDLTHYEEATQEEQDTEVVNEERRSSQYHGTSPDFSHSKLDYSYFGKDASVRGQENRNAVPEDEERIRKLHEVGINGMRRMTMPDDEGTRDTGNDTLMSEDDEAGDTGNDTLMSEDDGAEDDKKAWMTDTDANRTSMLGGGDGAEDTDFLDMEQEGISRRPVLYRISTGERIPLPSEKKVFRLGQQQGSVDYAIPDNHAVSRSHADIIRRDNKYYVFDLGSKNKTYINNRALPSQYEVEINNGDILKLANEEFEFRWQ